MLASLVCVLLQSRTPMDSSSTGAQTISTCSVHLYLTDSGKSLDETVTEVVDAFKTDSGKWAAIKREPVRKSPPRRPREGDPVTREEVRPGDLVQFRVPGKTFGAKSPFAKHNFVTVRGFIGPELTRDGSRSSILDATISATVNGNERRELASGLNYYRPISLPRQVTRIGGQERLDLLTEMARVSDLQTGDRFALDNQAFTLMAITDVGATRQAVVRHLDNDRTTGAATRTYETRHWPESRVLNKIERGMRPADEINWHSNTAQAMRQQAAEADTTIYDMVAGTNYGLQLP